MSTFNDNIRRELGFGLISWNTPEHRPAMPLSRPQLDRTAPQTGSTAPESPAGSLASCVIVQGGR